MLTHGSTPTFRCFVTGFAAAVFVVLVSASCQKMPLVAPSGTAITLIPTANVLPVNGSTDITAVLIEGALSGGQASETVLGAGTPVHNGTLVTFLTTLGRIEPAETRTEAGRATVRLVADGRSGIAVVTALSGAATQTVEVNIGAAGAARVTLTASPQSLSANGGQSGISARVQDQAGNGLNGVTVSFATTRGTLSATSSMSNDLGMATTTLSTTQEATITARAGGATDEGISSELIVTVKPKATVSITAPQSATVGVPAAFTFTPAPNATITQVVVDFGDGGSANLRELSAATVLSHAFRRKGIMDIGVRATDSEGTSSTTSTQVAVAPLSVVLSFSPSSVGSPQVGTPVTFTATTSPGAIVTQYEWDFGDGEKRVTSSNRVSHSYGGPGSKVASVRVLPIDNGDSESDLVTVDVKP